MGLNFRKSFKVGGVRFSVGKKGLSSASVGVKGARLSLGRKGARTTVSIPKTGLSYSTTHPYKRKKQNDQQQDSAQNQSSPFKTTIIVLLLIIFFAWLIF